MIRWIASCVLLVWPVGLMADALPPEQADLFLSFASDVSGDDPAVMKRARGFVAKPPTTLKDIGFYGVENAPPAERALRGIIAQLDKTGHLITVEDKYSYELPYVLEQSGAVASTENSPELDLVGFFARFDEDHAFTNQNWADFKTFFLRHVNAMDAAVAEQGLILLSVNLPLGDTLYFWAAPADLAAKWQNRALYSGVNTMKYPRARFVTFSVTAPAWDDYWDMMTYAFRIPEAHWEKPDGL